MNGAEIPFFIREGRAHWQAKLRPPAVPPRAEDLLVFWCTVPPGKWLRVERGAGNAMDRVRGGADGFGGDRTLRPD